MEGFASNDSVVRQRAESPERLSQRFGIGILHSAHPKRREAEQLIEAVYTASFDVALAAHFPTLIALFDDAGGVVAAAGSRRADKDPLFLEHYLDEPIERTLTRLSGRAVRRAEIAEIGNLATLSAGPAAPMLFAALAAYLAEDGATFAVATATRRLRRAFKAFGFGAAEIAPAARVKLPNAGADWGRYFDHDPVVVWGRVAAGVRDSHVSASL